MKIGIVGLGLIGGSLGLDFRKLGHRVLGVSRQVQTCERAIARGAVDEASVDLKLMQQADVIFLCTPLGAMEATVKDLIPHLAATTVLTDVGSVKGWVMQAIAPYWSNFVGGHPMAGTTENGIEAAQYQLFVDRPYVLTPTAATPEAAVKRVEELIRPLQVRLVHCHPEEHDRAVAWISHLPVMISGSLIAACRDEPDARVLELAKALASSGFRDTSRVGGGNPELGMMMAKYNTEALMRSLHSYRDTLDQFISYIEHQNWETLQTTLRQNQQIRPSFTEKL